MNSWIFLAQVDPTTSSILSLVGSLGTSAGAVVVTWMFISYLKSTATATTTLIESIRDNTEVQRRLAEAVDRICRMPKV